MEILGHSATPVQNHDGRCVRSILSFVRRQQMLSVHQNLAAVYRRKIEELESLPRDTDYRDEAIKTIRSMIESITLTGKSRET